MPDPTVALIFLTMLAALLASLGYSYWYQSLKHKSKARGRDQSLKASELEKLIRDAVEQAALGIGDRFDALEQEVHSLNEALQQARDRMLPEGDREREPLLEHDREREPLLEGDREREPLLEAHEKSKTEQSPAPAGKQRH